METLLYSVFIANSENMTITSLARVLSAEVPEIKNAMGVAVQLGFATRMSKVFSHKSHEVLCFYGRW